MATKIETNILKLYLITATRQNKPDEVKAFFEKNSDSLQYRKEWKDWFGKLTVYPRRHVTLGPLTCTLICHVGPLVHLFQSCHIRSSPAIYEEPRRALSIQDVLQ